MNTFIPYTIDNKQYLIASYTCTPLVRFSLDSLKGSKVVGTTIAELGNRNRPLDMFVYKKDGREFVLMSNNSRGVMKIPTESFGTAARDYRAGEDRNGRGRVRKSRVHDGHRADGPAGCTAFDRAHADHCGTQSRCGSIAVGNSCQCPVSSYQFLLVTGNW